MAACSDDRLAVTAKLWVGSCLLRARGKTRPRPRDLHTYYMTSNCALADACARCEGDACKHLLSRTYADFSEKMRTPEGLTLNWP